MISFTNYVLSNPIAIFGIGAAMAVISGLALILFIELVKMVIRK